MKKTDNILKELEEIGELDNLIEEVENIIEDMSDISNYNENIPIPINARNMVYQLPKFIYTLLGQSLEKLPNHKDGTEDNR